MKKVFFIFSIFILTLFTACKSTQIPEPSSEDFIEPQKIELPAQNSEAIPVSEVAIKEPELPLPPQENNEINLLFAGDIMAHAINYQITSYEKIWRDVKDVIEPADLAFANVEAPIDTTKPASTYPNFNMTKKYVQAAINAGFDVFSLANNHTNDQGLNGILETLKTTATLTEENKENGKTVYFAGTKETEDAPFTYHLIEKNGWKILFLPVTELLNSPKSSGYINFVRTDETSRFVFTEYCKKLREENPCDLFVLSFHTAEPEYTRKITERQRNYYLRLLDAGVDVLMANHAHIIKDREFIYNNATGSQKFIMYANGNVISGQRTKPDFKASVPDYERDNTGDGLFYYLTFEKDPVHPELPPKIKNANHLFITTYINTANEFVIKKCDDDFVNYLYDVPRNDWAEYIKKRIKINNNTTKDYITWQ